MDRDVILGVTGPNRFIFLPKDRIDRIDLVPPPDALVEIPAAFRAADFELPRPGMFDPPFLPLIAPPGFAL